MEIRLTKLLSVAAILLQVLHVMHCEVDNASNKPHSRQKRLTWITNDGRLALPPGTALVITPSLGMPFVRYPPVGYFANISISLPFTIDFDKLGLTDNENPYGILPPIFARSVGRAAGTFLSDYIAQYFDHRRSKRSLDSSEKKAKQAPTLPKEMDHAFHGGERALLYAAVEDMLTNFGMDGKACLLRAICEVHAHPLESFGLLGEMLRLFFTASKSPYSHVLEEYVDAESVGAGTGGSTECWPYHQACPKSLFMTKNKYTKEAEAHHQNEDLDDDELNHENSIHYSEVTIDAPNNNELKTESM